MKDIQFRKCKAADWQILLVIAKTTFVTAFGAQNTKEDMDTYLSVAFSPAQIKKELSNPHSTFYFVESQTSAIGYLKLNIEGTQSEPIADGLEIERIYLLATFQGKGIGQLMLDKAFEIAKQLKKRKVWLGVWEKNDGAIRFYERNGFQKFGEHEFYLGKDLQTDWLMETSLGYA